MQGQFGWLPRCHTASLDGACTLPGTCLFGVLTEKMRAWPGHMISLVQLENGKQKKFLTQAGYLTWPRCPILRLEVLQ